MSILSVAVEAMGQLQSEMDLHACDQIQLNWKQADGRHVTVIVGKACDENGAAKYALPPKEKG